MRGRPSLAEDLSKLPERLRGLVALGMLSGLSRYEVSRMILEAEAKRKARPS